MEKTMHLVTASEMQRMDQETIRTFGLPGIILMENAGRQVVDVLQKQFPDIRCRSVGIAAGRGNNGGDGFVIARYLSHIGVSVSVYLFAERTDVKGDAAANLFLLDRIVPVYELPDSEAFFTRQPDMRRHDIWVDAILGTGLNSDVKGFYKTVIEFFNCLDCFILAVDIPSGLNADTGMPCGSCIHAHTTVTFGFAKLGHVLFPGADFTGHLEIVDIGIPPHISNEVNPRHHLLTSDSIAKSLPSRLPVSHKGTTGHVLIIAGSTGKSGAAALAGLGALRSGAGLVTLAIPDSLNTIIQSHILEAMTVPLKCRQEGILDCTALPLLIEQIQEKKCLAIGPGIGVAPETRKLLLEILQNVTIPVIIDADGLNCICDHLEILNHLKSQAILTPHPGEMSRLTGASVPDIQADRIGYARRFSETHQVHVILKGARTIVAHPDGTVYINPTGNSGMATGGMGDILTGILAGLAAQGLAPETASHVGVYIHGNAADKLSAVQGPYGFPASDVVNLLPAVIKDLLHGERS